MSISKAGYIETPVTETKNLAKSVNKKAYRAAVENHSTMYTLFLLAAKHKTGLLVTWGVLMTTAYLFPFTFDLIFDFLKGL